MLIIRNFIHVFRHNKVANLLNIVGLMLAFTAVFIILIQVDYTLNYNKDIQDNDRIFRLVLIDKTSPEDGICLSFPRPYAEYMKSHYPNIRDVSIQASFNSEYRFAPNGDMHKSLKLNVKEGINDYLSTFSPKVVVGDLKSLNNSQTIVLPRSMAMKIFGKPDPIGEKMEMVWTGNDYTVGAVIEDYRANNMLSNSIFLSNDENKDSENNWNYNIFFKLDDAKNVQKVQNQIKDFLVKKFNDNSITAKIDVRLQPIEQTILSEKEIWAGRNHPISTYLLICFSIIILIIATINFVNFKQAEMPMRIRSLSTQKILGASRARLSLVIILEAVITSVVAFILSCVLIYLLPSLGIQELVNGNIKLSNWPISCTMLAVAVIIGIISGSYPSYSASKISPIVAIKGNIGSTPRGKILRTILISFQYIASMILIIWVLIMQQQSVLIKNRDYGFDKDHIVYAPFTIDFYYHEDAIKDELQKINGVAAVGLSQFVVGSNSQYMEWGQNDDQGRHVNLTVFPCDKDYLKVLGLKVIEGHDFGSPEKSQMIVTKNTSKLYPFVKTGYMLRSFPIVGIVPDISFSNLYKDDSKNALAFAIFGTEDNEYKNWGWKSFINVRIDKNVDQFAVVDQLNRVLKSFAVKDESEFKFIDQAMNESYKDENQFFKQITLFAILSVLITIIGVFGLTMFETEYRRKEIGIRKILGSTVRELLLLFNKRYFVIISICFVVGAPIGYYIGHRWLMSFAIQTSITPWMFAIAYLIILAVSILTVSLQCLRRALQNPVKSIRTE